MTNKILDGGARRVFAALGLCLLLAACGPGGGGTGTGPVSGVYSGKSLQGAIASAAPGNCAPQCGAVDLVVREDRVELATDCRIFRREGDWELDANGGASLSGTLTTTIGPASTVVPATLQLQFSEHQGESARVTATVLDENGRPFLGPFNMQRGAAVAPAFGSCPSR
ncbi:hypothetical protein FN976_25465 [Caenimonas sedimenti]|uniref:Lipoprotein n=1 Tax=Caenimonas sedimenti TaxID=2596921 RepID=A0A562ZGN8_9BURK|nr:hypothetical protein [Caenimonas sedimenti]TWO67742.1 hypothetical protein FN976_25465 [Caenimonas sedimenti]